MKFIDACHQKALGVKYGLYFGISLQRFTGFTYVYDGGFVYDYSDYNRRYSPWDSVYFDLGKNEVKALIIFCRILCNILSY